MAAVPRHDHPEIEDRITAEMSVLRTEIDQLRSHIGGRLARIETEVDVGFASVARTLDEHGAMLRRILASLEPPDGDEPAT